MRSLFRVKVSRKAFLVGLLTLNPKSESQSHSKSPTALKLEAPDPLQRVECPETAISLKKALIEEYTLAFRV